MKIACFDRDMKGILESGFYRVPRFQRPYSWDRENVDDFWNDVVLESGSDYFIGSMVLHKPPHSPVAYIVDGQQRLTTITMVLCALRNTFRNEGFGPLADGVHHLVEKSDLSNSLQYVLQTETSYPYLQEIIQKNGASGAIGKQGPEEVALKVAFELINKRIKDRLIRIPNDSRARLALVRYCARAEIRTC